MLPAGPLMIEHRLIERMVALLRDEQRRIGSGAAPRTMFLGTTVDFFRTYADRCHHGKEEDILFRDLESRPLSPGHRATMDELVAEHIQARSMVGALLDARDRYDAGDDSAQGVIVSLLGELGDFYPAHIMKEDKHFFLPVMGYFSEKEQQAMLAEFAEFDRQMIHEAYRGIVENLEQ